MKKRIFTFLLIFSFFVEFLSGEGVISDYTVQKVEDFVSYRVLLKSEDDETAFNEILQLKESALSELAEHAVDFEQEECILESLYLLEYYEHSLNSTGNQKELRTQIKNQMKKNTACIDSHKKKPVSEWLYQFTGDVTAYYMTRSVPATLLYGFKVKGYYEKSIEINKNRASSLVALGNWCFYAPGIAGGGKSKAKKYFDKALEAAELPGEKYLAYIAVSQINFENKNNNEAADYLSKAVELELGQKDLDLIARCNKKGYSYFQYLRNRSGIDEEMSEDEKDDDDK
ncbi:hypothetical protein [Treponema sp.]|uniref:hypothetical protein n=1 Tax=Treponema sp. TaxID=166 RepID=UPI0038909BE1